MSKNNWAIKKLIKYNHIIHIVVEFKNKQSK